MDVANSLLGALTGSGGGVQIEIVLDPPFVQQQQQQQMQYPPQNNMMTPSGQQQYQQQMQTSPQQQQQQFQPPPPPPVVLDHHPSWKLHRNPFWRVKHPAGNKLTQVVPYGEQHQQYASPTPQQPPSPYEPVSTASNRHSAPIYVYRAGQDVHGRVIMRLAPGTKKIVEHLGIKVMFLGRIDMSVGIHEGKPHYDFISLSKELAPPSSIMGEMVLPFKFRNLDMEFESYRGRNVSVRYIIKVKMERKFLPPVSKEHDLWVQALGVEPNEHEPIKMEVGIEDCLHIEFQYDRRMYHLQDVIRGKIHFLLVRIKIKHMELAVIRRETSGEGVAAAAAAASGSAGAAASSPTAQNADAGSSNIFTETQTLLKYEIMDGAPVKDEIIPVKLSLQGIPADVTPTYTAVNNRFSVRYFLNLVLVDEDDRRYFKQQEIILWRKQLG